MYLSDDRFYSFSIEETLKLETCLVVFLCVYVCVMWYEYLLDMRWNENEIMSECHFWVLDGFRYEMFWRIWNNLVKMRFWYKWKFGLCVW